MGKLKQEKQEETEDKAAGWNHNKMTIITNSATVK